MKHKNTIIISLFLASSLVAKNDFFQSSQDGWFFYKDPAPKKKQNEDSQKDSQKNISQVIKTTSDYNTTAYKMSIPFESEEQRAERRKQEEEYMNNIPWHDLDNLSADEYRRLLDTTRDISVATPKKQYVASYASLQKFWVDKSEMFAKVWQVATMDDPSLLYEDHGYTHYSRKKKKEQIDQADLEFMKSLNNDMGYIIVVENINNYEVVSALEKIYNKGKEKTGLDYIILDYYEVPEFVSKYKVSLKNLPDNFISYRGKNDMDVVKRFRYGYPSSNSLIKDTKFIFDNAIEEKYKKDEHKLNDL
jgi:conjugal transfer pilus assembly protein TraF